jgi:hypothetical protein
MRWNALARVMAYIRNAVAANKTNGGAHSA